MPTLPPPAQPVPSLAAAAPYGFANVTIGSTLADLHRLRPQAQCGGASNGVVDCTAKDQPVGGGFSARDLTYRFVSGRLAQIRFHSSVDAFAFVVAKLKHDFGQPGDIRRDNVRLYGHSFPHEAFTWRNGRSTIQMSDPAAPNQLAVTITFDAEKSVADGHPA